MNRVALSLMVIALASGCSSGHHASSPVVPASSSPPTSAQPPPGIARIPLARGPRLRVILRSGCPRTIAAYEDVANDRDVRTLRTLLPPSTPTAALICRYGSEFQHSLLQEQRGLGAAAAAALATVVNRLDLKPDTSVHGCPADSGLVDILVLSYRTHSDVDLWWHADGCQSLDNGDIVAAQINSPSFGAFQDEILRLAER